MPRQKIVCSLCSLRELCLPIGLDEESVKKLELLTARKRRLKKGEYLYRAGEGFKFVAAVRSGFFKTVALHEDGREQVAGFQMMGDILGMDAISNEIHACDAVALEDSEVCEIPFASLSELSRELPILQHNLHCILSREILREQGAMMLLWNLKAEERLAAFLLNLSERFSARGYSAASFRLRMTREEIGSYLGLQLETVSRTFTKLQGEGLVSVRKKLIEIKDIQSLKKVLAPSARFFSLASRSS